MSDRVSDEQKGAFLPILLGVRGEVESAIQCVSDDHVLHHLRGALAMLDGVERDLETVIATAYKTGFSDSYAKQVIAAMKDEIAVAEWCAVEGCDTPPELLDLETKEFVCRGHLDYPDRIETSCEKHADECADPGCPDHGDDPHTLVTEDAMEDPS